MSHLRLQIMTVACLVLGCDGGDASKPGKADAKPADAKPADAKPADAKPADAKAPDAKPAEVHFDTSKDKSGVLARSAAVLDAAHALDNEHLHELSHHAEKAPAADVVCKHVAGVRGTGDDISPCVKQTEHHVVRLGPEIYAAFAACLMESTTPAGVDACEAAAAEAETALHDKAHGEGLDEATCDTFFVQFEKLAMVDAGDHTEIVKEVLQEVRADVLSACVDQGTKAEMDCATKAKSLQELSACAPQLL